MSTLFTLLLADGNGRASTKGLLAVLIIACYIGWYLLRAGRYLFRKAGWLAGEITGSAHRISISFAPEAEPEADSPEEELLQNLFSEGEEEVAEDIHRLRSLLMGYYTPTAIREVYLRALAFQVQAKDKSEEKLVAYIRQAANGLFTEYDAKVLHDYVTTREFRLEGRYP